jgi:hypothetical protein
MRLLVTEDKPALVRSLRRGLQEAAFTVDVGGARIPLHKLTRTS